jgi:hypothetical protein
MRFLTYLILVCSFSFSPLFAGTILPHVPDRMYIEYGERFEHVVRLKVIDKKNKQMFGSAVIINNHWILTAAHMVQDCRSCVIEYKNKKYCLEYMVYPKEFVDGEIGKLDIAIGYSKTSFDVPFEIKFYEESNEVGKICSIVGFGITGNFSTGARISDSKKRGGSNRIKETLGDLLICSVTDNPSTKLEFLIANGDSGGGLFIDGKLAGINSCVLADDANGPNSDYGDESGHTRISENLTWIKEIMEKKEIHSNLTPTE